MRSRHHGGEWNWKTVVVLIINLGIIFGFAAVADYYGIPQMVNSFISSLPWRGQVLINVIPILGALGIIGVLVRV